MSLDSSSSWEVRCTLHKEHYPASPRRGSEVLVKERVKRCISGVSDLFFFSPFHLSARDVLHNIPLHMCGRDQLWTVPLPPLHVRDTGGHQPRVRLVHVLRVGRTGPHAAGWVPVHAGPFPLPSTHPRGAQAQAGERLRVTGRRTSNGHLSHPETVTSPVQETVSPKDSEQGERQRGLHTAWHRGSTGHWLSLSWKMTKRWHMTEDDFSSSGAFFFPRPSLWMNCSVLLLALREENSYTIFFSSCKIC